MSTLACNNVAYAYEKGNGILTNISFCFESGKMYAILGPSGSGKRRSFPCLEGLILQQKETFCLMIPTLCKRDLKIIEENTFR